MEVVDIPVIHDFIEYLTETEHLRPNTVNAYLASIRKMFEYIRDETLSKKMLPDLTVDSYLPRVPSPTEVGRMIQACPDLLSKLFIVILVSTGLRISEAIALKFSDILTSEHQIHVSPSKSRRERLVPLNDTAIQLLKEYCLAYNSKHPYNKLKPTDYVFFNEDRTGPLKGDKMRRIFNKVQKLAGLEEKHFTPHGCRHFFALQYYLQSHDILLIKRLLGHKSLAATEIYLILAASIEAQERYVNPLDVAMNKLAGDKSKSDAKSEVKA